MMQRASKNNSHLLNGEAPVPPPSYTAKHKQIPKNPLNISKKLALLKKNGGTGTSSLNDESMTNLPSAGRNIPFQSSRNLGGHQQQPNEGESKQTSSTFDQRKKSDLAGVAQFGHY